MRLFRKSLLANDGYIEVWGDLKLTTQELIHYDENKSHCPEDDEYGERMMVS